MAQSVYNGYNGPGTIPLGFIQVVTPGTPVRITSLIDPASNNAPETPTPAFSANNTGAAVPTNEYTVTCQQIIIQGFTSNAGSGLKNNTGNVYLMLKGNGTSNRTDFGAMEQCIGAGLTAVIASAPANVNCFDPYKYYLDADNSGDGALVTIVVQ
jgi:hypothetical protein